MTIGTSYSKAKVRINKMGPKNLVFLEFEDKGSVISIQIDTQEQIESLVEGLREAKGALL